MTLSYNCICYGNWSIAHEGRRDQRYVGHRRKRPLAIAGCPSLSLTSIPAVSTIDEERKVIVAERGPLIFVFNFNTK